MMRLLLRLIAAVSLVAACSTGTDSGGSTTHGPTGSEPTPWERYGDDYDLSNVITNQGRFEAVFNGTYQEHDQCDAAYAAAEEAERRYREALEADWPDFDGANSRPGVEYDFWVARFLASTQWLQQQWCPGAMDFVQVG